MDLDHALEIADESLAGGYNSMHDQALHFLAEEAHIRDRMAQLLAETAVALKGPEKALHRHGWQDLPEVAAKQAAALKLAKEALETCDIGDCSTSDVIMPSFDAVAVDEALAAIDEVLKGE